MRHNQEISSKIVEVMAFRKLLINNNLMNKVKNLKI
jgi:hypothetical protein